MKVILFYFLLYNGNTTDGMGELTLFNHDEVFSLLIYLGVSAFQGRWDWDVLCKFCTCLASIWYKLSDADLKQNPETVECAPI